MTHAERHQRIRRLSERLTAEVARTVPSEVWRWDEAWTITDPAAVEYNLACVEWIAADDPEDTERLRRAYDGVVDAWKRAAVAYERDRKEARP